MKIIGIIPARYASERFPGKPLADIHGKSMIRRVYEQSAKSKLLSDVIVATDDKRIYDHVKEFGNVVYTSEKHQSGTERCNEAVSIFNSSDRYNESDVVVNIQGDEPLINPLQIDTLVQLFINDNNNEIEIGTLVKKLNDTTELFDEDVVKVVFGENKRALYFSRAAIPYCRNLHPEKWPDKAKFYKHIGIYAYKIKVLNTISKLKQSELEAAESLEQLRWLENGRKIFIAETELDSYSIDKPADINKLPLDLL